MYLNFLYGIFSTDIVLKLYTMLLGYLFYTL